MLFINVNLMWELILAVKGIKIFECIFFKLIKGRGKKSNNWKVSYLKTCSNERLFLYKLFFIKLWVFGVGCRLFEGSLFCHFFCKVIKKRKIFTITICLRTPFSHFHLICLLHLRSNDDWRSKHVIIFCLIFHKIFLTKILNKIINKQNAKIFWYPKNNFFIFFMAHIRL